MTDPISDAVWPPRFAVLSKADRETRSCHTLEALSIALEATKLAVDAANEAPRRAGYDQPTAPQIFEYWAAANLLVHVMFDHLHTQARHSLGVIKPMLTLD